MNTYGFSAYVRGIDPTSDDQLLALSELDFDASVGGRDGNTIIEVSIDSPTPFAALTNAAAAIETCGAQVIRIDHDLVTVSEIADRAGTSRETVRLWVTGQRRGRFPRPFSSVGTSNVWAWADVYPWLLENGQKVEDLYPEEPVPSDVVMRFNGNLARTREIEMTWKGSSNKVRMSSNVTRQRRTKPLLTSPWGWEVKAS